ncbi:NAD(P)H-dependent flavin oxidoreductase [Microbacterium suaedae]|uniref:NAD(P)H-dependent flavin oxidoreductase n=1 Tax=Microbacterium suaedae TaxID=2067813 RepID=UPI001E381A4E|nr:nitronate monooxygenase [Microbacterium suaedae]
MIRAAFPALFEYTSPVWAAPMAGGPTTPALVVAAARAGHMAQLAAGYKTSQAMNDEIAAVRAAGVDLFGVNLFVPNTHVISPGAHADYARALGIDDAGDPREDDDAWNEKIAALVADPVPLVSFTFGLPRGEDIAALRDAGSLTAQTVTSLDEERAAVDAGVDILVVQGAAAGGHSGVWTAGALPAERPLAGLVAEIAAETGVPIVAAGGISSSAEVAELLGSGTDAVAVGTALLRAAESGTSSTHRAALEDPRFDETVLTRAFTGRYARALRNAFVDAHDADAPSGYPAIHHLTRPLRAAAAAEGDAEHLHLWAGRGWRASREAPVAEILAALVP